MRRAPCFGGPSKIRSIPANLVLPPKPASLRRTGSGGNTANALAVNRARARQSDEPAFAALAVNGLGISTVDAEAQTAIFEARFPLLADTPNIYPAWTTDFLGRGFLRRVNAEGWKCRNP
jgi:hypothetical protein